MNNVKIIYFNIDTIDCNALERKIKSFTSYRSHYTIKPGLLLINYNGTAKDLYEEFGDLITEKNIFIHDLDSGNDAFWGYMNKKIWDWVKENRN